MNFPLTATAGSYENFHFARSVRLWNSFTKSISRHTHAIHARSHTNPLCMCACAIDVCAVADEADKYFMLNTKANMCCFIRRRAHTIWKTNADGKFVVNAPQTKIDSKFYRSATRLEISQRSTACSRLTMLGEWWAIKLRRKICETRGNHFFLACLPICWDVSQKKGALVLSLMKWWLQHSLWGRCVCITATRPLCGWVVLCEKRMSVRLRRHGAGETKQHILFESKGISCWERWWLYKWNKLTIGVRQCNCVEEFSMR